jgi:hypothetical protein
MSDARHIVSTEVFMADGSRPPFPHRKNANGTHDSICPRCFATIATEQDQNDLLAQEAGHVCRDEDLLRMQRPKKWLETNFGIQGTPDHQHKE